jgi:charged multivesicular body protein 1
LKKGETQQAYQKARMLLAKQAIAKQMDQAADVAELSVAQIQANNAMNRMTAMMAQSSRTMSRAQKSMNPEKVRQPPPPSPSPSPAEIITMANILLSSFVQQTLVTLEQFKNQNEEYAMSNNIYQDAMTQSTSVQVSEDAVHELLGKLADDAGVELSQELASASASKEEPAKETAAAEPTPEQEDALQQRLRALRA